MASGSSDLGARVLWAIPAIAFALFIVINGGWIFALGVGILGLASMAELLRMYAGVRPVRLGGLLTIVGLVVAAHFGSERQVLLAFAASLPVVFVAGLLGPPHPRLTAGMAITFLGVLWIGLAVSHAIMLRELPHGEGIVITILVGTFVGDTGAYLGGRALGRRPLAPHISPNKTVEGLLIGAFTAVLAVWCAKLYQDWLGHGEALLLGLAVAIAAPIGDLFESKVKRDAATKDAGTLFGAHGGALDRLDAAFFSLVAGYYVWLSMI
jgi:phosphatidate cytidylyltransferase